MTVVATCFSVWLIFVEMRFLCIIWLAGFQLRPLSLFIFVCVCVSRQRVSVCVCEFIVLRICITIYSFCCCRLSSRTMKSDRKVISIDWSQWMSFDFLIFFFFFSSYVSLSFSHFILFSISFFSYPRTSELPHKCINETNKKNKTYTQIHSHTPSYICRSLLSFWKS